jgi:hypothetical protein
VLFVVSSWMRTWLLLSSVVAVVGCDTVASFVVGDRERVLVSCDAPDGSTTAHLVEPPGQWQDQFVIVRITSRAGAVLHQSDTIGFAAGSVDGLGYTSDGMLVLTATQQQSPRIVYDVNAGSVVRTIEYGQLAPDVTLALSCPPPQHGQP